LAIDSVLLMALVAAALFTVMTRSLLRAAIGLALTSAILAMFMYMLNSPVAAVFELSVCAGLISALFFSIITITEPLTPEKVNEEMRARMTRFWYLPIVLVIAGIILSLVSVEIHLKLPAPEVVQNVRQVLWNMRQLDLVGQIIILLAGVFGIVILLKEAVKKNG